MRTTSKATGLQRLGTVVIWWMVMAIALTGPVVAIACAVVLALIALVNYDDREVMGKVWAALPALSALGLVIVGVRALS